MVGKPKARGHRAHTQGVCSHICGAYSSLDSISLGMSICVQSVAQEETPAEKKKREKLERKQNRVRYR